MNKKETPINKHSTVELKTTTRQSANTRASHQVASTAGQ